jgi:hypothetical protein
MDHRKVIDSAKQQWAGVAALLAFLGAGSGTILYAGEEWHEYLSVKEAAVEQKKFNKDANKTFEQLKMQQSRIDERTQIMLDMLKDMNSKLVDK